MRTSKTLALPTAILLALLCQCVEPPERSTAPAPPPYVIDSRPADLAFAVDPRTAVEVQLSAPIDPATLDEASFRLHHLGEPVPAVRSYDPVSLRAVLTPTTPLLTGVPYELVVTEQVRDPAGRGLAGPYHAYFVTSCASGPAASDGLYTVVWGTGHTATDTLRIWKSCSGVLVRGRLTCPSPLMPVEGTVIGVTDQELRFTAGMIGEEPSMRIEGAFSDAGGRWCASGTARVHAAVPEHPACDETRAFGPVCLPAR
jgi:hypothetical protein